jgi:ParB family transcriptional regulator, chromosome partitioning protein
MTALKRRALGRGLDALIPGTNAVELGADPVAVLPPPDVVLTKRDFFLSPIEDVHPSPDQPRQVFQETALEELAQSIRTEGIIQPLVVRERDGGGFILIAGERRWRAAQRAGLHEVPVVIRDVSPSRAFEMALVENVQRADLNPIEEAEAYRRLSEEFGYTQEQMAERVGKDRATIANALRLLKLPHPVRALVQEGALSMGHARALLGLEDETLIATAARKVVSGALSVRATEDLVRKQVARERGEAPAAKAPEKSPSVKDLEQKLTQALGAKVTVSDRGDGKGGKIEIGYANLDDLDRILEQLLATARN